MKRILLAIAVIFGFVGTAQAQKVTTRVVDNKGTIKWALDSTTAVLINAKNGVIKSGDTAKLGGALTEATTITTSATNTLALPGLQSGTANDSLVVSDATTGVLRRVTASSLLISGDQVFAATVGQVAFAVANIPAIVSRVWVFRNGVKLVATTDYTTAAAALTLLPGGVAPNDWAVIAGDKIEVQWVK